LVPGRNDSEFPSPVTQIIPDQSAQKLATGSLQLTFIKPEASSTSKQIP
jgi:hypothetical protein